MCGSRVRVRFLHPPPPPSSVSMNLPEITQKWPQDSMVSHCVLNSIPWGSLVGKKLKNAVFKVLDGCNRASVI